MLPRITKFLFPANPSSLASAEGIRSVGYEVFLVSMYLLSAAGSVFPNNPVCFEYGLLSKSFAIPFC